jgi:hypothetical protein
MQMLEEQIGLGLPIFHFFDLIVGTSSGKYFIDAASAAVLTSIQGVLFRLL